MAILSSHLNTKEHPHSDDDTDCQSNAEHGHHKAIHTQIHQRLRAVIVKIVML